MRLCLVGCLFLLGLWLGVVCGAMGTFRMSSQVSPQFTLNPARASVGIAAARSHTHTHTHHLHMSLTAVGDARTFALEIAAETLPRELERVGSDGLKTLAEVCAMTDDAAISMTTVGSALADQLVPHLLAPPGEDVTPKLHDGTDPAEARAIAELYWRCAVAVGLMPSVALEALARHHKDLTAYLGEPDAPTRRSLLVRGLLPRFAMVCTTREEAEAAERRREEIEKMKQAASAERAAEANSTDGGGHDGETDEGVLL